MQFAFAQHLLVLVILTSAFFAFLQYVDRAYKEAIRDLIKEVKDGDLKPLKNPQDGSQKKARILYDKITNPEKTIDNTFMTGSYFVLYIVYGVLYFGCLSYSSFFESFFKTNGFSDAAIYCSLLSLWCTSLILIFLATWQFRRTIKMKKHIDELRKAQEDMNIILKAYSDSNKGQGGD